MNTAKMSTMGLLATGFWVAAIAAEVPLRDFARDPEFTKVELSPTGEYLAVTMPVGDQTSLAVLRLADMKMTGAARFRSKEHVANFWWVGPQRVVATVAKQDGPEAQPALTGELFAMDADGSKKTYLFGYRGRDSVGSLIKRATKEYASASMIDPLPDDPEHALIAINYWSGGRDSYPLVARLNVYTGARTDLTRAPEAGRAVFLADSQGQVRYVVVRDLKNELQTFWRERDEKDWKRETVGVLTAAEIVPLAFSEDGSTVYLDSTEIGDKACLVRRKLKVDSSRERLACDDDGDLARTLFAFDREDPIGAIFTPGKPKLKLVGMDGPDRQLLAILAKSFGENFVVPVSSTRDGSKIVVLAHSDRNPGDYYLFDRKTNQAKFLLSERSWIDPAKMAERRPISYKTRDGHTIFGYLTLPPGVRAEKLPMVVNPHGGPFGVRDGWRWDADAQMLASRGYAVLQVNFRGSGGYGLHHERSAKKQFGKMMIDDITDGVKWAIGQNIADPNRLCIYGGSFGGYAALMSAVRESDLYRCAVGYVGVYDLELWAADTDVSQSDSGENYIRDFIGPNDKELAEQSPLGHIDRLKAAVMIVHGEQDKRVPFNQAKALRKALDKRKHPHEWLVKSDEGHGFYEPENREELYAKMLTFLERYIGNKPAIEGASN